MIRSAERVAEALRGMHSERFGEEHDCKFCIGWRDFRDLAGGGPAGAAFILEVQAHLADTGHILVPLGDALLFAEEWELETRLAPGRIVDKYLEIVAEEEEGDDFEMEDDDDE